VKALELYRRNDNPLYLPETGCPNCARFFFTGLGLETIGFSPAADVTTPALLGAQAGIQAVQAGNPGAWEVYKPVDDFLTSWGMNFRLIGPMQREIARLNSEAGMPRSRLARFAAAPTRPGRIPSRLGAFWWLNSPGTSFWWPVTIAASTSVPPELSGSGSRSSSFGEPMKPRPP
jgi:hypothetical protein